MKEKENQQFEKVFSVSEFIALLNIGLKKSRAKIIGEVSEVSFSSAGHVYFYLKDQKDQSVLKCLIYKEKYHLYGVKLGKENEGVKIIADGYPNLHKTYGFSFIAEVIEYAGEGELKKEYEKLKAKLTQEGLFAPERKRLIPVFSQKIGVITSLKGAVLADFSNNLAKFGFKVKIIDSRVEGQESIADLLLSIKAFKKEEIEVLVIMRGGGSLESMAAFNNELLVREVAGFPAPVIAAIGHDKDAPLAALASDLAVSTPSIAATTLSQSWQQAIFFLERRQRSIVDNYSQILDNAYTLINQALEALEQYNYSVFNQHKEFENKLKVSLESFKNSLLNAKINLKSLTDKSFSGFKLLLSKINRELEYAKKTVNFNNPERQLMLGYSIARNKEKIIKSVKNAKRGDSISIQVSDGEINSKVNKIKQN